MYQQSFFTENYSLGVRVPVLGGNFWNHAKELKTIGLIGFLLHTFRRLYETLFVSVFSSHSKINIFHFLTGIIFYVMAVVSQVVCLQENTDTCKRLLLKFYTVFRSKYQQHLCFKRLASIRSAKDGAIKPDLYGIPCGHLFNYISSPHYTIEIILYILLSFYYRLCSVMVFCCLFVTVNQTVAAILTHRWYLERYGNKYPASRKALIPFFL
ncbi:unnamed protein product [Enterobius vermicularis]|uniref:Polyprenal reductase n=1 Tax=Enterobius vermicularis TaxID=51028 RepID=A0A0N4UYQ7_ENTVE|nr:unnamed protein product [Enterobius vermicularis]